jgi:hypothetical protein
LSAGDYLLGLEPPETRLGRLGFRRLEAADLFALEPPSGAIIWR